MLARLYGVLLPFFVSFLLAYLLDPLVGFVQNKCKVKYRGLSVTIVLLLCIGLIAAAFGICGLVYPNVSAETIAIIVGTGIIFSGFGYWVRLMLVNKAENRLEQLQARINAAVEEIASAPEK